jgi:hypothetical protein
MRAAGHIRTAVLLSLVLFLPTRVSGQMVEAQAYAWPQGPAWQESWDGSGEGTEVLVDDLSVRFRKLKPEFLHIFFERRRVVRFASREDIRQHARVLLPESLDPPLDQSTWPWADRALAGPGYANVRVDHFAVRIISPDGSWYEPPVLKRAWRERLRELLITNHVQRWVFDVEGIAPGDVVEFRWKYAVPYDSNAPHTYGWRGDLWLDNWSRLTSWRIFFHGELPIREQRVEVCYHRRHGLVLGGRAAAESTERGNIVREVWHMRDLPGCMGEVNARPGTELPHIVLSLNLDDPRFHAYHYMSRQQELMPHWVQVLRRREADAHWYRRVALKKMPDRQTNMVRRFIAGSTAGIPPGNVLDRLATMHDRIAADHAFQWDDAWFADLDQSLLRLGTQLDAGLLREISRYHVYAKLFSEERVKYRTAYLLDKRVGAIDVGFLTPLWANELLFTVGTADRDIWMFPKRSRHGWFTNEIPFYWQDTRALIGDVDVLWPEVPQYPSFVRIPQLDPANNMRGTELSMEVAEEGTTTSRVRIFLSGQFSTLCRPVYLDGTLDSTVHPIYGATVLDAAGARVLEFRHEAPEARAPHRFRAEANVAYDESVVAREDSLWHVDLSTLLLHAVPTEFRAEGRTLPFHWDFAHHDRFRFELRFPVPVELPEDHGVALAYASSQASLQRSITQPAPDRIIVESRLDVGEDPEAPAHAAALEALIRAASGDGLRFTVRSAAMEEQ